VRDCGGWLVGGWGGVGYVARRIRTGSGRYLVRGSLGRRGLVPAGWRVCDTDEDDGERLGARGEVRCVGWRCLDGWDDGCVRCGGDRCGDGGCVPYRLMTIG